jgi:hypothetical protein
MNAFKFKDSKAKFMTYRLAVSLSMAWCDGTVVI